MNTKLQPHQISAAHQALSKVKSIDDDIKWLVSDVPDKIAEYGEKFRIFLGRNRMDNFTNMELGDVVNRAVINALLVKRAEAIAKSGDLVEFPDAPRIPTRKAAQ